MPRQAKLWTGAELKRASLLWSAGLSMIQIASELERSKESVKHQIAARRDLFPRRRQPRSEIRNDGPAVAFKFTVTPFMHRAVKKEARRRGISQCMVVREALRDVLLRHAI